MTKPLKILVLSGGESPEREVSLRSGQNVGDALSELGHNVVHHDPASSPLPPAHDFDIAFPALHGIAGEDGSIQHDLERAGHLYVSSDPQASELAFNKARLKELLAREGIATPRWEVVSRSSFANSPLSRGPFVLKPIADGSSLNMLISRSGEVDTQLVDRLFDRHSEMLLEELIEGPEITIGVLADAALPAIEIIPPAGEEFDYDNKYNGRSREIHPPENVSEETQQEAQRLAERVHRLVGARHLSRTDFMIDGEGKLYLLEINTIPGLTAQSLYPKAAAAAGMSFAKLVERLVELAFDDSKVDR